MVGDATGDIALWAFPFASSVERLFLLDGHTGEVAWHKQADAPRPLGDLDGDGRPELGTQSITKFFSTMWGVRYQAFDGEGHPLYTRTYGLNLPPGDVFAAMFVVPDVGPADADAATDAGHVVLMLDLDQGKLFRNRALVSGRTGRRLWKGTLGNALGASVDGHGTDLALLTGSRSGIRVEAQDGATGHPIWRSSVSAPRGAESVTYGADLTGDGRAEVIVNATFLGDSGAFRTFVLSGRDGAVLWSR
jgi:outer membrane protein assembly factor BamB